ncbi:hypothetical protein CPC08DRAFT_716476 [Agrocybe pediades]|nr:hypothetical protein CPC08DRAFT_716476 [Agrocybe pediades]
MQLKLAPLAVLTTLLSISPVLSYVTTTAFSNSVACHGDALLCTNHEPGQCCWMPVGFGYSVLYSGMPRGSTSHGYPTRANCKADTNRVFTIYSEGGKCWNSGGLSRAAWLRWDMQHPTFPRVGGRVTGQRMEGCDVVEPDVFRYSHPDGGMRAIKIPKAKGSAQKVVDLHAVKDFEALEEFEEHYDEYEGLYD